MAIEGQSGKEEFLDRKILEFLKKNENPQATPEGITAWWQNLQTLTPSLDELTSTLENLVEKGLIEKKIIEGDIFIYTVSKGN